MEIPTFKEVTIKSKYNKTEFIKKLHETHGNHTKKAYETLVRKMHTLKQSLKKRSLEYNVTCNITLDEIKKMFYFTYGKSCVYCGKKLHIKNIACDHITPFIKGGTTTANNLRLICKSCNARKGPLAENSFISLLLWLDKQDKELKDYVMRKLAKGGRY